MLPLLVTATEYVTISPTVARMGFAVLLTVSTGALTAIVTGLETETPEKAPLV
ncbi:hypothetical protein D3C74_503350 [compost metagenome]